MKTRPRPLALAELGIALMLLVVLLAACGGGTTTAALYHCPMHPTYVSDKPGDCPICLMKLVPIEPDDTMKTGGAIPPEGYSTVRVSADGLQLAGIQTAPAVSDTAGRSIRAVGIVKADETRVHQVNTRVAGWVQKLPVNFTGQFVRRGDPLLTVYSPELMASQEEYLRSLEATRRFEHSSLPEVRKGAQELMHSARKRLLLFDVPESFIKNIEQTGQPESDVTLRAPATGYVTGKDILAGARIEPGMRLYTIADLSRVWIEADVYESEASLVRLGSKAVVTLPFDPAFIREAPVSYVYPTLNPMTRTLRIRLELDNPGMTLKPDMFADVAITVETGQGVVIPDDAILDSGIRKIVFVETGPGTFEPREIRMGVRSAGVAQVLSGVAVGERVVVKANFLLDSESRLRSAIGAHGGHQ
jgi:RND family efflux transporter MFP subunit